MTVRPADLDKYLQLKVLAIECICYEYTCMHDYSARDLLLCHYMFPVQEGDVKGIQGSV